MEGLAWASEADPKKAVGILDAVIRKVKEEYQYHIQLWDESIYTILQASLKEESARSISRKLIDYLGRSGYSKCSDLLDKPYR